jgi:hypothetical protein
LSAALEWLLEEHDPGVRYLALRDILGLKADDRELARACQAAHEEGPIAQVLNAMHPDGYWVIPGPGYFKKYRSTVWAVILLAQLGARPEYDKRITQACDYLLEKNLCANGQFSVNGTPSGTVDCLQGNLCAALTTLGCEDSRLEAAYDWMRRTVTGEGMAPQSDKHADFRYYAYKCGPGFACGVNNSLPCAWGASKVMLAFASLPVSKRTPHFQKSIAQGVDFLFSVDPATAAYPSPPPRPSSKPRDPNLVVKPNRAWWKFGFPVFYVTDILHIVEVLSALGYGMDERLDNAYELIRSKQDERGRWALDYEYNAKTWVNFGRPKEANKWVTLRALRAFHLAGRQID